MSRLIVSLPHVILVESGLGFGAFAVAAIGRTTRS
jgi:hypothetical protein